MQQQPVPTFNVLSRLFPRPLPNLTPELFVHYESTLQALRGLKNAIFAKLTANHVLVDYVQRECAAKFDSTRGEGLQVFDKGELTNFDIACINAGFYAITTLQRTTQQKMSGVLKKLPCSAQESKPELSETIRQNFLADIFFSAQNMHKLFGQILLAQAKEPNLSVLSQKIAKVIAEAKRLPQILRQYLEQYHETDLQDVIKACISNCQVIENKFTRFQQDFVSINASSGNRYVLVLDRLELLRLELQYASCREEAEYFKYLYSTIYTDPALLLPQRYSELLAKQRAIRDSVVKSSVPQPPPLPSFVVAPRNFPFAGIDAATVCPMPQENEQLKEQVQRSSLVLPLLGEVEELIKHQMEYIIAHENQDRDAQLNMKYAQSMIWLQQMLYEKRLLTSQQKANIVDWLKQFLNAPFPINACSLADKKLVAFSKICACFVLYAFQLELLQEFNPDQSSEQARKAMQAQLSFYAVSAAGLAISYDVPEGQLLQSFHVIRLCDAKLGDESLISEVCKGWENMAERGYDFSYLLTMARSDSLINFASKVNGYLQFICARVTGKIPCGEVNIPLQKEYAKILMAMLWQNCGLTENPYKSLLSVDLKILGDNNPFASEIKLIQGLVNHSLIARRSQNVILYKTQSFTFLSGESVIKISDCRFCPVIERLLGVEPIYQVPRRQ